MSHLVRKKKKEKFTLKIKGNFSVSINIPISTVGYDLVDWMNLVSASTSKCSFRSVVFIGASSISASLAILKNTSHLAK